jgi:protein involved in polysaccharide export with SLBB domain
MNWLTISEAELMNTRLITGISRAAVDLLLVIALLLVAMAQGARAQQSPNSWGLSEIGCQQIAVIGAVRRPSRLDAPRRLRLLEVLGKVGGPNEQAGKTVRIIPNCNCSPCDKLAHASEYSLADVLRDRETGNPYVVPGNIVVVPVADSVFVIESGHTGRSIRFSEGMTVTRAIAMAGGVVGRISELVRVRIHRASIAGVRQDPIIVNLRKSIGERGTEDVLLQPWDIVEVSDWRGHFQVPRMSPPTWDPPLPKWNPPLHPRKETSGSTLITGASWRGSTYCIDSALVSMGIR